MRILAAIICINSLLLLSSINFVVATEVGVTIKKFKFIPAEITVNKGDIIIWKNKEKRQYHSVWFEQAGDSEPDYFFPDESYTRQFKQSGIFPYRCGPHPEMKGIITVK